MQRTLKYVILGLLNQQSRSGYDLSAELSGALKEFWSANHSQIYPELKRLTEEGLVEYRIEISGSVLERKVYSLTPAGKADFLEWLQREEDMIPTPKDIFRLRMFFSNEMEPERRLQLTRHELDQHVARLAQLKEMMSDRFPEIPENSSPQFGDCLVLSGAILREEAACAWLKQCIKMMSD